MMFSWAGLAKILIEKSDYDFSTFRNSWTIIN